VFTMQISHFEQVPESVRALMARYSY